MKRLILVVALILAFASTSSAQGPYRFYRTGNFYPSTPQFYRGASFGTGGYFVPGAYMPYSYSVSPAYGGAVYSGTGGAFYYTPWVGAMGFGAYVPYSGSMYVPAYGMGMY